MKKKKKKSRRILNSFFRLKPVIAKRSKFFPFLRAVIKSAFKVWV